MSRLWLLASLPLLLISGCSREKNSFTVSDPRGQAVSATLQLCGSSVKLDHGGHSFHTAQPAKCEGGGDIVVKLADGTQTPCHVGYLTRGAGMDFEFVVDDGQCQVTAIKVPSLEAKSGGPKTNSANAP